MSPPRPEHAFPPSKNSTSETLSRQNMPLYCCSSSHHLPTRLLKLCPHRSAFIHTTTLILGTTLCCSSNKRSQSQRPHHTYTETTALASHPCPYCIQNLPPHVSHPFWNLSIIRHALLPGPEDSDHPCVGILL